eukprot:scaffold14553_cov120-Isochrysis_galbana.AAC.11
MLALPDHQPELRLQTRAVSAAKTPSGVAGRFRRYPSVGARGSDRDPWRGGTALYHRRVRGIAIVLVRRGRGVGRLPTSRLRPGRQTAPSASLATRSCATTRPSSTFQVAVEVCGDCTLHLRVRLG